MGRNGTRRIRTAGLTAALLSLLTTVLVATPAASQQTVPGFLYPGPDEIVSGTIPTAVRFENPNAVYVDFWIFWEGGQFNYGRDTEPGVEGEHGRITTDRIVPGIWEATLEMPPSHPPGTARFVAEAQVCEDPEAQIGCELIPVAETELYADGTPPDPTVVAPGHATTVPRGDEVVIEVATDDDEVDGIDLFLRSLFFLDGKGLPKLDQHDEGSEWSADDDGDGETGDMSCAPTAAGSSLAWFGEHGYPGLLPEGKTHDDVVDELAERAGTDDNGTSPGDLIDALREEIDEAGLSDELEVRGWGDEENTDLETLAEEFGRGQDVLLGLYWDAGGAHRVAVENIRENPDGSTDILIMDPWTGEYETVEVDEDGNASQDGAGLEIKRMIHVSPTQQEEETLGTAAPDQTGWRAQQGSTFEFVWDTSTVEPGSYMIRAEATDDAGVSQSDFLVVHVSAARSITSACPPDQVPEDGFADVAQDNVHEAAVDCVTWWEIAAGTTPATYEPGSAVSRAQMAAFVARLMEAAGYELPSDPADAFPDDDDSPHELRINQLAEVGVVSGRSDGTYGPHRPVRRDQMATFLVDAYETATATTLAAGDDAFDDDDGNVHEANIDKVAEAGIAGGTAARTYAPGLNVRRDQMASFVSRTLATLVDAGAATPPGG